MIRRAIRILARLAAGVIVLAVLTVPEIGRASCRERV